MGPCECGHEAPRHDVAGSTTQHYGACTQCVCLLYQPADSHDGQDDTDTAPGGKR